MSDPLSPPSPPSWAERLARWRDVLPRPVPPSTLVVGAVVAVALVAGLFLLTRPSAPPPAPVDLPRATTAASPPTSAGGPASPSTVTVHAAGAVAHPGVYVLAAGARVADAVAAAGGALPEAAPDLVNLAARANDGDRVYLPRKGEAVPPPPEPGSATAGGAAGGRAEPLDLNAATPAQLDALPGIGPALAQAIVEYRNRHGRFRAVGDLVDVPGIGPAKLSSLRPLVRV